MPLTNDKEPIKIMLIYGAFSAKWIAEIVSAMLKAKEFQPLSKLFADMQL